MAVSGPSAPPGHDHTGGQSQRRKSLLVGEAGGDSPPSGQSLIGSCHNVACREIFLDSFT